jgi:DNA-binding CsgD family transcriptional regulator
MSNILASAICRFAESIRLTDRQRLVFTLLVGGHAPKEIATSLDIAHVTVRRHLEGIYCKSGTQNQRELLALFARVLMTPSTVDPERVLAVESGVAKHV